tara:strand:- start:236 stop:436 length:201 start_codon:yes stop_codon:yes gene_type:complete
MKEYRIDRVRRACYEVTLVDESKDIGRYKHLTNFTNKKAALKFIEAHKRGEVTIDPETGIPTPDFK